MCTAANSCIYYMYMRRLFNRPFHYRASRIREGTGIYGMGHDVRRRQIAI